MWRRSPNQNLGHGDSRTTFSQPAKSVRPSKDHVLAGLPARAAPPWPAIPLRDRRGQVAPVPFRWDRGSRSHQRASLVSSQHRTIKQRCEPLNCSHSHNSERSRAYRRHKNTGKATSRLQVCRFLLTSLTSGVPFGPGSRRGTPGAARPSFLHYPMHRSRLRPCG